MGDIVELGELGRGPRGPIEMSFLWHGTPIRVAPDASDLDLLDFLEVLSGLDAVGEDDNSVATMIVTVEYLKKEIHPDDWAEFRTVWKREHQLFADLMLVARSIAAAVGRFPTGRSSDSSDGPHNIAESSTGGSSSSVATAMAAATMASYEGRPDLKEFVYQVETGRREAQLEEAA